MGQQTFDFNFDFKGNNADVKKSISEIKSELDKALNSNALRTMDKDATKVADSMRKVAADLSNVTAKLEEAKSVKIPTDEYTVLQKTIQSVEKELDKTIAKQERMESQAYKNPLVQEYTELQAKIKSTNADLERAAQIYGSQSKEFYDVQASLGQYEQRLERISGKAEQILAPAQQLTRQINDQKVDLQQLQSELTQLEQTGKGFTLGDPAQIEKYSQQQQIIADKANVLLQQDEEMRQKEAQIAQAESERIAKLIEIQQNSGAINSELGTTISELNQVNSEIASIENRQRELESAGRGLGYAEYDQNLAKLSQLYDKQAELNGLVDEYREKQSQTTEETSRWSQFADAVRGALSKVPELMGSAVSSGKQLASSIFAKIESHAKNAVGHLKNLASHMGKVKDEASKATQHLGKMTLKIAKALIGVRGLFALIRKLKSAVKEGYTNLAKETQSAQYNIDLLKAKFMQLKNSVGAAIAPLVDIVAPVITRVIDLFTRAFNAVAMFFGALSGKGTVKIAKSLDSSYGAEQESGSKQKSAQEKYDEAVAKAQAKYEKELAKYQDKVAKAEAKQAKAAAKLAKEQDKANKQLAGFDELNVLTSEDIDDTTDSLEDYMAGLEEPELEMPNMEDFFGGGAGGLGNMFEEVEVGQKFKDLVDDLKKMWEDADFTELGAKFGQSLKNLLDGIPWDAIQEKADKLGKSLATFINGFAEVAGLGYSIGKTFAEGLNTVFHALDSFVSNLHWRSVGSFIADTINGWFENIDWDLIEHTFVTGFRGLGSAIDQFIKDFNWDNLSNSISRAINIVVKSIYAFFSEIDFEDLAYKLETQLSETIDKIDWKEVGRALGRILQSAIDFLKGLIKGWKDNDTGTKIKNAIKEFFQGIAESLDLKEAGTIIAGLLATKIAIAIVPALAKKGIASLIGGYFTKEAASSTVTSSATTAGYGLGAVFASAVAGGVAGTEFLKTKAGQIFHNWTNWAYNEAGFADMPVYIKDTTDNTEVFAQAWEQVQSGLLYTNEDIQTMIDEMGLTNEQAEALNQAMFDNNSELSQWRDTQAEILGDADLWDMAAGDVAIYKDMIEKIADGHITNEKELRYYLERAQGGTRQQIDDDNQLYTSLCAHLNATSELRQKSIEKIKHTVSATEEESQSVTRLKDRAKRDFQEVDSSIDTHVKAMSKSSSSMNSLKDTYQTAGDKIDATARKSKSWGEGMVTDMAGGIDRNTGRLKASMTSVENQITSAVQTTRSKMPNEGEGITKNLSSGISSGVSSVYSSISHLGSAISSEISYLAREAMWWGRDIIDGIASGISRGISSVASAARSVANTISSYLHFSEPDVGPLSDFHTFMPDMIESMVQGIEQGIPDVEKVLDKLSYGIAGGVTMPPKMAEDMGKSVAQSESSLDANTLSTILSNALGEYGTNNRNADIGDIVIQIDGREIFRVVRNENNSYINRTGRSAFSY